MSTTITEQTVPTGTWTLDKVHSTFAFSVRHSGVSQFKGGLPISTTSSRRPLRGSADVSASRSSDENLQGHLLSPDFFDAERFPASRSSRPHQPRRRRAVVEGELEIRGVSSPSH